MLLILFFVVDAGYLPGNIYRELDRPAFFR